MIIRFKICRYRITFTFAPVTNVLGVNSNIGNDQHILMWDFDNTNIQLVESILKTIQDQYELPPVYIFESSPNGNYIAYCFVMISWRICKAIIASTPLCDENFFKYGVYRGHFTLRVGPKLGNTPKLIKVLPSKIRETASVSEMKSWVRYETLAR